MKSSTESGDENLDVPSVRQNMVRSGKIIADCHRRKVAEKDRASVLNLSQHRFIFCGDDLQMLRSDLIGDGDSLLKRCVDKFVPYSSKK